jgi:NADPH:quinone reductase-like Zn-dependent oxidoreductase
VRAGEGAAGKLERARALGLDEGIAVGADGFADEVMRRTGGRGVDVVLELVGGGYLAGDLACAATSGRIVLVGLMAGARAELDLASILRRRLHIVGTVLRARPLEEKILAARLLARHVAPLIARGALRPVVDRVFPLAEAAAAHACMAGGGSFGKLVLSAE